MRASILNNLRITNKLITPIIILFALPSISFDQDLSNLYKELSPSVVVISTIVEDGNPYNGKVKEGLGSGIVVDWIQLD